MNTELKCSGCQKNLTKEGYDHVKQRPNWFGKYTCDKLIEWICVECWDKGLRYKGK